MIELRIRHAGMLLAGGVLSACTSAAAVVEAPATDPTPAAWRDFPVAAEPRPIVLSGSPAHSARGNEGYTYRLTIKFEDPAQLPAGPSEADGYAVVDAKAALDILHAEYANAGSIGKERGKVTGIRFGAAEFWTDRGLQRLPAWLVDFAMERGSGPSKKIVKQTAKVLAVAPSDRFGPNGADDYALAVTPDGKSLLANWRSRGTGGCKPVFTSSAVETDKVVIYRVEQRQTDPEATCRFSLSTRSTTVVLTIDLQRPLGNRVVLLDGRDEFAYPVLPCGSVTWVPVPACPMP